LESGGWAAFAQVGGTLVRGELGRFWMQVGVVVRSRYRLAIGLAVMIVTASVAVALFAANRFNRDPETRAPRIGGHFALTTADGRKVTDRSFRGKWMLIYFGYTFCPDACPTALHDITIALQQLGPLADKVQPIFITVDSERDTPPVMTDYVGSFDSRFIALRGTPEETAEAAREYRVYYSVHALGNDEYAIDHSSFIYLMNPEGALAKLLTGDLPGHQMADELRQFIR
jgi:protein SCO1